MANQLGSINIKSIFAKTLIEHDQQKRFSKVCFFNNINKLKSKSKLISKSVNTSKLDELTKFNIMTPINLAEMIQNNQITNISNWNNTIKKMDLTD